MFAIALEGSLALPVSRTVCAERESSLWQQKLEDAELVRQHGDFREGSGAGYDGHRGFGDGSTVGVYHCNTYGRSVHCALGQPPSRATHSRICVMTSGMMRGAEFAWRPPGEPPTP